MINDLDVSGVSLWKYVDDLTVSEIVSKNMTSNIQSIVDDIQSQSESLKFTLNEDNFEKSRTWSERTTWYPGSFGEPCPHGVH